MVWFGVHVRPYVLTKGNFAKKKIIQKDDMETAQEKIKRPVADKERFIGYSEPGLAQRVQERPKKKRRSGDAAALGKTKDEEYYRPATLSHGGQARDRHAWQVRWQGQGLRGRARRACYSDRNQQPAP